MATTPRTFISFDFDNNSTHKMLFAGQAKNSKTPFEIADWSSKEALPQATWQTQVSLKVSKCHIMIVLVGKSAVNADGIKEEIEMAVSHQIPYFGVYVDGANSLTQLPIGLARNKVIAWDWDHIAQAIETVMKE